MTDFELNFVESLKPNDKETQIEKQLSLAETYIYEKRKTCARLALLIVYNLLKENNDREIKSRYNKAVDLFKAL